MNDRQMNDQFEERKGGAGDDVCKTFYRQGELKRSLKQIGSWSATDKAGRAPHFDELLLP